MIASERPLTVIERLGMVVKLKRRLRKHRDARVTALEKTGTGRSWDGNGTVTAMEQKRFLHCIIS